MSGLVECLSDLKYQQHEDHFFHPHIGIFLTNPHCVEDVKYDIEEFPIQSGNTFQLQTTGIFVWIGQRTPVTIRDYLRSGSICTWNALLSADRDVGCQNISQTPPILLLFRGVDLAEMALILLLLESG